MTGANPSSDANKGAEEQQDLQNDSGSERTSRFRIVTIKGKRRAFALEPIFWNILEEAAEANSLRLGDYVTKLLENASRANHSALLRVKAAEWAERRREQLSDKGIEAIGRRIAASHSAPSFLINRHGAIVAHNKALSDLLREGVDGGAAVIKPSVQLRLGVTVHEMMRVLKMNPDKFLRIRFSLLFDGFERQGVLNAMLIGEEADECYALGIVQSMDEKLPRR